MLDVTLTSELSDDVVKGYFAIDEDAALVDLTGHLSVFSVAGEDRKAWLNGQVTNELRSFLPGSSADFCLCKPTGQILALNRAGAFEQEMCVITDASAGLAWRDRFESSIIMEDVQWAEVVDNCVLTLQGPNATRRLGELVEIPALDCGVATLGKAEIRLVRSNRTAFGGWDVFVPKIQKAVIKKFKEAFPEVPSLSLAICGLEAGHPRIGTDVDAKTMPPELGPAFEARNVSYSKGCYTGQEVLMRIHSRGHTNRTWVALQADAPMKAGDRLLHMGRTEVGIVTTAFDSPRYGYIAGAMVKNQAAFDDEIVTVSPDGQTPFEAVIRHFPIVRFD